MEASGGVAVHASFSTSAQLQRGARPAARMTNENGSGDQKYSSSPMAVGKLFQHEKKMAVLLFNGDLIIRRSGRNA